VRKVGVVFVSSSISVVLQVAFSVAVILLAVIVIAGFVRQRRFKNLALLLAVAAAATAILSLLGTVWYAGVWAGLIVVALAFKWFRERRPPQSR
jgi:hypothetical protein